MLDLYKHIDKWNGEKTFIYIVTFIVIIWFLLGRDIKLNLLVALLVASFIVSYLNDRSIRQADTQEDIKEIKLNAIKPKLNDNSEKNRSIIDFLFSIQDLYPYNPQQYEELIRNINQFYDKYELSFIDTKTSHINYGLMDQYKRDALNSLQSLVFSLPDDKKVRDKLNNSCVVLDNILTKDLDKVSYIIDEHIYKNGYNVDSKIIDYKHRAFNEYDDIFGNYSYEIY